MQANPLTYPINPQRGPAVPAAAATATAAATVLIRVVHFNSNREGGARRRIV